MLLLHPRFASMGPVHVVGAARDGARCSYLRIDVSLNTLFIFVRYIPRRWNPPRGEVRSTGNTRAHPRGYDISRGIKTRARVQNAGVSVHNPAGDHCALFRSQVRQSTRRGRVISMERALYIYYTFLFFHVRPREISPATMRSQVLPADPTLKAIHHPERARALTPAYSLASNIIIMPSARPLCDAINARDGTTPRDSEGAKRPFLHRQRV